MLFGEKENIMNRWFDVDNGFFRFMGKVCDMILLDILTLICCIPIVTIGPALTALYYVSLKIVRDEEGYVFRSYFKSFKQNFVQGFLLELIAVIATVVLYVDLRVAYNWMMQDSNILIKLLFYALVGFALLAAVTVVYIFPVLAKFENSTRKILINSVMMAVRHLQLSILMVIIVVAAAVAVYIYPIAIFFVVGLAAFINSAILRKIFDNYIKIDSEGRIITGTAEDKETGIKQDDEESSDEAVNVKVTEASEDKDVE